MATMTFEVGDVLELTQVSRNPVTGEDRTEYRTCIVSALQPDGNVSYQGYRVDDRLETGQGAFRPERIGTTKYGFTVAVRKIGRGKPVSYGPTWTPRPGNRGYDSMC